MTCFLQADDLIKMEMLDVVKHDVEGEPVKNISQEDIQMAEQLIQAELRPVGVFNIII